MSEYDFAPLSSYDFERLVRDLIQQELNVRLESFTKGRDRGIDFRFRNTSGDLVVQCKHYQNYDDLIRILKRDEIAKVRKLSPKRYVLATSAPLTPTRKDEISQILEPFCASPSDILGREDLNNLLGRHSDIERKHIKLWLTSEAVLTRVLNGGIWGDSELTLERIRLKTSRYVPNPSYKRAVDILNTYHYCIIAGIPGIGKTTLAEILLVDYVDRHGYQAVRIAQDLSEIKAVKQPKTKQIFYFDDFLGKTALDKLQKNEDQRLVEFIEEVRINGNWRFILTTREYILNTARIRYEALASPSLAIAPCIIKISDYTRPIRARILYNHIYFSDLPAAHKRALIENHLYERILAHPNYNPRIIDHMTQAQHVASIESSKYFEAFLESLSNPKSVWDAFRNQLSEASQHLMLVMGTLPDEVLLSDLERAFNRFYQHRRQKVGFSVSSRDFENALKQLDGNFIKTSRAGNDQIVEFHNPSVNDFVENYLSKSSQDVEDLIISAEFFDQYIHLWKGCRGVRFDGIDKNSQSFFQALESNFSTSTCSTRRVTDASGQTVGLSPVEVHLESRALFALECADILSTPDGRSVTGHLLDILSERAKQGRGHKPDLIRVLQKIRPERLNPNQQRLLSASKSYLLSTLEDMVDFRSLTQFMKGFPGYVSEPEVTHAREHFELYCAAYDVYEEDDPEDVWGLIEEIDEISIWLDFENTDLRTQLEERALELEDKVRPEDDYDDDYGKDEWERTPPDDVESMFEGLLDELNEDQAE